MKNSLLVIIFVQFLCYSQFAGGSGTAEDPWLIRTPENLDSIRYFLGAENDDKYFKQIADINLGVAPWNEGKGWEPIGYYDNEFKGSYNGESRYNIIRNLTINDTTKSSASLFGVVKDAEIAHVHFEGVNITGLMGCGALTGTSINSTIRNCSVDYGSIHGYENEIGGLIGSSIEDSISCCYSSVDVEGLDNIGGLIGVAFGNCSIENCYSQGNVTGSDLIGGLIGWSIENIFNPDKNVIMYKYVKNLSDVKGEPIIFNSYSTGFISASFYSGGLIAGFENNVINSYWDTETSGQLTSVGGEGRITYEMVYPTYSDSTYVGWDFENIWIQGYPTKNMYPILRWQTYVSIEEDNSMPTECKLVQNYPNPFNPTTEISFAIQEKGNVKLTVYNSKGELVKVLFEGSINMGTHSIQFDASALTTGIYFYKLSYANRSETRKMLLLK